MTQFSFASGEISPALRTRADLALYSKALRTCRNFMVRRDGGAWNRPGTAFLGQVKDSSKATRLLPFVVGGDTSYAIELGDHYARFWWVGPAGTPHGLQVTEGSSSAWSNSAAYTAGDMVEDSGTFYLCLKGHTNKNPASEADYWYAQPGAVVEVPTPWGTADLAAVKYVQSADVMTLVNPSYPVYELRRHGTVNWELRLKPIGFAIEAPENLSMAVGTADYTPGWSIGFVSLNPLTINFPSAPVGITLYELSFWLSLSSYGSPDVHFRDVYFFQDLGSGNYKVCYQGGEPLDLSAYHALVGIHVPGNQQRVYCVPWNSSGFNWRYVVTSIDDQGRESFASVSLGMSTSSSTPTLVWDAVAGARSYNVYKSYGGTYGFVRNVVENKFLETSGGVEPDFSVTPPVSSEPAFALPADYPAAAGYYQQRLFFGNVPANVQRLRGSATGRFDDFSVHDVVRSDDALDFVMASNRIQSIKALVDVGRLVVFTEGGEWSVGDGGALTPSNLSARQHSYYGIGDLPPLVIGYSVLFIQSRGQAVRDLAYDFTADGYRGNELSLMSSHLLDGRTLVDWTFAQVPHGVVWMVRDDGVLLGMTYVREQQMFAWHRHDTSGGSFEAVCSIPESDEDAVYFIVKRGSVRCVERLSRRQPADFRELNLMDAAFAQNRWENHAGVTVTVTSGAGWTEKDALTLTLGGGSVVMAVGDEFHVAAADGSVVKFRVNSVVTPNTVFSVTADKTVPADLRATAAGTWADARPYIGGLQHLVDGTKVSVYADGDVLSDPVGDPNHALAKQSWGGVDLPYPVAIVTAGLPVTADHETLDIATAEGPDLAGEAKLVGRAKLHLLETRGLWVGDRAPAGDSMDGLTELKLRDVETYDDVRNLYSGVVTQSLNKKWNRNGRVFLRQTKPLPATILAITPEGLLVPGQGQGGLS